MLGHIVAGGSGLLGHGLLLDAPRQAQGERDGPTLAALVATREEDDESTTATDEVHAVAGTAVDAQFDDPAANGGAVTGVPGGQAFDSSKDARSSK